MDYDGSPKSGSWLRRNLNTVILLALMIGLSAFFRIAFNYDPAINDGEYRFAGNDDYYHLRVVEHVQTTGEHLARDELINYPVGGMNPRPPLYDWHAAILGRILDLATPMDAQESARYALEWGSALWGVLTVIPIWLIGRQLFGNAAGIWAGFLIAASPAHIQRSGFGLGDHDAFIIFFFVLGIYFLIRALQNTRDDTKVARWTSLHSVATGFGTYVDAHRLGLAYAFLAGVCWAAIGLMWEGYPYVTAVFAVYYVFQLLYNQVRRRDSTGDVLVMGIVMGVVSILPLPYYWTLGHVGGTLSSHAYIFAVLVLVTALLVPTRDLPSILVLPGILVMGVVTWAVLTFLFPDIGQLLFTANGYFNRSKLYSTIAEAQRTDLGFFVFSIGFLTFFLALIGFVYATIRFFKTGSRTMLFMVGWGVISIYMAFAATRFVFNAAPVFAILAGWMTHRIVKWIDWRERLREFRAMRHESYGKATRSMLRTKQIAGSLFIGLFLIVPNVWFSVDAGLPSEVRANYRQNHPADDFFSERTGAFGQGFLAPDWINIYGWLAGQDAVGPDGQPLTCLERPAHMAWWDYGFWEVALGCHPTVSDNFQNGVDISGRFLASQSEKEAIEFMMVRLLVASQSRNGGTFPANVADVLRNQNASLPDSLTPFPGLDGGQEVLSAQTPDAEAATELYLRIADATETYIGYFLCDSRMLPLDDPSTPTIESGSIFYAPIYLANKNPDDFIQTVYVAQDGSEYRVTAYDEDAAGNSFAVDPPRVIGPDGKQYFVVGGGGFGSVVRTLDGKRIDYSHNLGQGAQLQATKLDYKPAIYQSMFYRCFVGGDGQAPPNPPFHPIEPARDLEHFRLVRQTPSPLPANQLPAINLLKFYWGAVLEGRVTMEDSGAAFSGATVEVFDDFGIRHDRNTTDADGRYRVLLPFSLMNETSGQLKKITVRIGNQGVVLKDFEYQVTEDQAMRRAPNDFTGDVAVGRGSLDVFAYIDRDRNDQYDPATDAVAAGAEVTFLDHQATAGSDGHAILEGIAPGRAAVGGSLPGYTVAREGEATVMPGERATTNLSFEAARVAVSGVVQLANGTGVGAVTVNITAVDPASEYTEDASGLITDNNGNFTGQVRTGGSYRATVQTTRTEGTEQVTYSGSTEFDLAIGAGPTSVSITVTRTVG